MRFTLGLVALVGWVVSAGGVTPVYGQELVTSEQARQARRADCGPMLGVMADAGLPDGAIASLVVRPWKWFRAYGGGGTNSVSKGWRGGFSLLPFGAGPSLSLEYGHYSDGDANGLVRSMAGGAFAGSPVLSQIGYDYANAHAGLDFGRRRVVFFIHGGVSMLWAQIHNVNVALDSAASGAGSSTVVTVHEDPKVKVYGSSLKVGLIVFLL